MIGKLTFLIFVLIVEFASAKQRTVVQGELYCDGKPYGGATVKLYDKDIVVDDLMAKNESKKDGSFYLDGTASDLITNISPKLYIYHKCNKGSFVRIAKFCYIYESCKREWIFNIPGDYVFKDTDKKIKILDVGRWELMVKPQSETSKCLPAKKA
uniref:Transthyretin-like family protein n=1 Tax=Romanomermis culicivorax TaxID=13658 RepID=A0A915L6S6_ROMCU